ALVGDHLLKIISQASNFVVDCGINDEDYFVLSFCIQIKPPSKHCRFSIFACRLSAATWQNLNRFRSNRQIGNQLCFAIAFKAPSLRIARNACPLSTITSSTSERSYFANVSSTNFRVSEIECSG